MNHLHISAYVSENIASDFDGNSLDIWVFLHSHSCYKSTLLTMTLSPQYTLKGTDYEASCYWMFTCFLLHLPSQFPMYFLLSIFFSSTLNACSSPKLRDKISYPPRTTPKLHFYMFSLFQFKSETGRKKLWTESSKRTLRVLYECVNLFLLQRRT